jgi:hypothetical protein
MTKPESPAGASITGSTKRASVNAGKETPREIARSYTVSRWTIPRLDP